MRSKVKRLWFGGLAVAWLLAVCGYAVYLNRSPGQVVQIRDLSRMDVDTETPNAWDGKLVIVEGFWVSRADGLSISTSRGPWQQRGPVLLIRRSAGAGKLGGSPSSILPARLQGDPVWLESDDRVRVTAIYHADGWGALGSMLESIEWLQVEKASLCASTWRMKS